MNNESPYGESSCKRQENGDVVAGSDRPLKKARFAWQVKGRHRLKNDTPKLDTLASTAADSDKSTSSSDSEIDANHVGSAEQNLEILGDYLLKQDFNTLDSVITDSEKSLLKPCSNLSIETVQVPRYVSSYELAAQGASGSINAVASMSHQAVNANEDLCIARWQARQMAKGFVDNTINRVLDSWMVSPLPAEIGNRILALDVAEFINNLPEDNSIENEGILMAISAHGLQSAPNSSVSSSSTENCKPNYSSITNNVFPSPPSSPLSSDDELSQSKVCKSSATNKESDNFEDQTVNHNDNEDLYSNFNIFPDNTEESNVGNEIQDNNFYHENESPDVDFTNHFNFMDAAVSFAIQNKGLTSYGTDYG